MYYEDLSDHPMAVLRANESFVSASEQAWYSWIRRAEHLFGKSLDGSDATDGYSLDTAYDFFADGATPEEFLLEVERGAFK